MQHKYVWPIYRSLRVRWYPRWDGQEQSGRLRLHRRRQARRGYMRCGPLASMIGRWKITHIDRGTGGPYNYDWYYWRKDYLPALRREPATCAYSVSW